VLMNLLWVLFVRVSERVPLVLIVCSIMRQMDRHLGTRFLSRLSSAESNVISFVGGQCEISNVVAEKQMVEKKETESKIGD